MDDRQERQERQRYALQTIFSFFLGLMVVAFIGVGVNTFYPSPQQRYETEIREAQRAEEDLGAFTKDPSTLSADEREKIEAARKRSRAVQDKVSAEMKGWARNTSIIIILFATVVMALSLVRAEQLKVISNGLLLGGLFTMLYGTGWVIFSGESTARFAVMVFALVVTLGLGYLKFVRGRKAEAALAAAGEAAPSGDVAALSARVQALEEWARAVASAPRPPRV